MSDKDPPDASKSRPADLSPEMRRGMSRRSLITDELSRASLDAVKQLPGLAGVLGFAFKEDASRREARLVRNLWQLLMGREPKPEESAESMKLVRSARTPDEKGDAVVDILWALCQTTDFESLNRPDPVLVRGLYRLALDRDPTEEERKAALDVLTEAAELPAKSAALEGLFTGLLRSGESVLRKEPGRR